MRQLPLQLAQAPAPSLENFVAGRNAELLHGLRNAADGPAGGLALFVWGDAGSGRTHLMRGLVDAVRARGAAAQYVACADQPDFGEDLRELACVAIDDIELLAAEAQTRAFNLYNALRERGAVIAVSAGAPPPQLALRLDLATRLGWGLVYRLHALSDEEKAGALRDHAAARGMRMPDEVCAYLLGRVRRDMRTLLTVLDALDHSSLAEKRAITLPFVRDWLRAREEQE